jgi:NAD(P)-dependent dehydrogenase (short-subunit alcohol dehydrogenase family)
VVQSQYLNSSKEHMSTVLIIGASRGLGLEFVKQYLAAGDKVIATARKAVDVKKLTALGATASQLDVTQPDDFVALKALLGRKQIDVAIYNAGVFGPHSAGVEGITKAEFDAVMRANVWGAMLAVPAVAPAVVRGQGVLAFVSSTMGSIANMSNASAVTYRASKTALNAVMKATAFEWGSQSDGKGLVAFSFHPGWVKTDMGGTGADIDAQVSISGMRQVIATARDEPKKFNGGFVDYKGQALPW